MGASIPIFEEEPCTDTGILVRDAIAKVREVARLDDRVRLPPLVSSFRGDAPPSADAGASVSPRRTVAMFDRKDFALQPTVPVVMPSPIEVVGREVVATPKPDTRRALAETTVLPSRRRRASRWPIFLCALVAIGFGGASYLASPYATKNPEVKRATTMVRAYAVELAHEAQKLVRT